MNTDSATIASPATPTVLVLLRGLIRSRFHWQQFPQQLQQTFPDAIILTPELAGNGERYLESTPASIAGMMADIRQQLKQQYPANTPLTLVAISMGAMIATEWAQQHPEEIQQLHLINTSFANVSPPWHRMRAAAVLSLAAKALNREQLENAIIRWTINLNSDPQLNNRWQQFAQQHPLSRRNALAQLLAASRYRAPRTAPQAATWLYNSLGDRLVNPACSQTIAERWQKPLLTHHYAGHDLPMDDGEWLAQCISRNTITKQD